MPPKKSIPPPESPRTVNVDVNQAVFGIIQEMWLDRTVSVYQTFKTHTEEQREDGREPTYTIVLECSRT